MSVLNHEAGSVLQYIVYQMCFSWFKNILNVTKKGYLLLGIF